MPFVKGIIKKEFEKGRLDFIDGLPKAVVKLTKALPKEGMKSSLIVKRLEELADIELKVKNDGKYFGSVFSTDDELMQLNADASNMFLFSDLSTPSMHILSRQLENEVVSMALQMYKGHAGCTGMTTSGGSESLELAILSHKLHYRRKKGITEPEVIICETAHSAFYKACDFFNVKLIPITVKKNFQVDVAAMERAITRNTILMVSSCPNYPYGYPDPLRPLAKLALKHDFGLHLDACMGGFLIPFCKEIGVKMPEDSYDFQVPGVTSISMDPHKYGLSAKGISVLLFGDEEIQKNLYYVKVDGPGPLYMASCLADKRSSAIIAASWATMMYYGHEGYANLAKELVEATKELVTKVNKIPGLKIVDNPQVLPV